MQEIVINAELQYVLIALPAGTTQDQLMQIQPDFVKLKGCVSKDQVVGVIVTCAGQALQ